MKNFTHIIVLFVVSLAYSQEFTVDCPKGKVNCTLQCGRYVDANGDTICDLSVPKFIVDEKKNKEIAKRKDEIEQKKVIKEEAKTQTQGKIIQKEIILSIDSTKLKKIEPAKIFPKQATTPKNESKYHFVSLTFVTFLFYFLSKYLIKKELITVHQHRQFWNTILLFAFLFCGLLGLYLVIQINYDIKYKLPFDIYLFHVDFGIVMAWLSIIHAWWHLKYYKNYLLGNDNNKKT